MTLVLWKPAKRASETGYRGKLSDLSILFGMTAIPFAAAALIAPTKLLLPLSSITLIISAALCAAYAWHRCSSLKATKITYWDLAGVLTVAGIAFGAMSDAQTTLQLFGFQTPKP